jgi:2-aminoadipate transaminase
MNNVPRSFIREIFKVTDNPGMISFAGGLPSADFFPALEIRESCVKVIDEEGRSALQYSNTEGYAPLRGFISDRYRAKWGLEIDPDQILITTGSQQALDLIGKVFLDEGDTVLIERPGYLGAIQCFTSYGVRFVTVDLQEDGPDLDQLAEVLRREKPRVYYAVPNFQNPSGISFSAEKRKKIADMLSEANTLFVEDDPYGELRFIGSEIAPVRCHASENMLLLGSFSKIVAPAFRLGWVCAKPEWMHHLVTAKQACDLHTNSFAQRVVYRFLHDYSIDNHIAKIREAYGIRREAMLKAIGENFPANVHTTRPEGGMFLWPTFPEGTDTMALFDRAIERNVAFVPGAPFYVNNDPQGFRTMRLNYTCETPERIRDGIGRLAEALKTAI